MNDPFLGILERARSLPNKLKPDEDKRLGSGLRRFRQKPIIRIRGKLFNRIDAAKDHVRNLLISNGHAAEVKAATRRDGSIDWEKLLQLIIKYLPQILAIILPLFT